MAIDKESSGFPEVDPTRPTSKVNSGMIVAIGLFYLITFSLVICFAARTDEPETNLPSPATQNTSGG